MTQALIPVILAGGRGERFWPLSRRYRPKQFLCLDSSGQSLLQSTVDRLLPLAQNWDNLWVITSAAIADGVREQLPELAERNLLVETQGRDTAPAVAWATLKVAERCGLDAVIGFFPADHFIADIQGFETTLKACSQLAMAKDAIVTLGIKPNYPSTGYGYIEQGEKQGGCEELPIYRVSRFTEKPDQETAQSFIATGKFSWNSGMFIFRAEVVLKELETYAPKMMQLLKDKGEAAYSELEKISIDYALMEKTQLAYVLPAHFVWDDLGDWNSLERLTKGNRSNVDLANHVHLDTQGTIVYSGDKNHIIATIGLKDLVIVHDGNVTLVINKERTQDIKKLLELLQADEQLKKYL
ncbi:mannose-1-phosphate guanylyltransferase [cyanobacterium endosymbiont of Rhopalodia gibberula]|uniref:mannose-1-phosphate guanylyltransferase n=1 Tax=cyanobacterium endosymbiont of Rhopalodia gibberula TaxID=1763363 RepID=UPI000DC73531|nr:mannose-1-phosphate guanylyltransferase [cyanobacterium endosymbiont of Rhopalodia gibberula]BBA79295.1 mannose-1-phosphate guanylyltransferase [cyanobacterium endosymbiont of Rhopalodia gibberula]